MDHAVFFFGFTDEASSVFLDEIDSCEDVVGLKGESGPGSFSFATTMNADGGSTDDDFAPDFHFEEEFGSEGFLVKFDGAKVVGCPDGIFDFENRHAGVLAFLVGGGKGILTGY